MKIKSIRIENNDILGNINFDFCDENGNPCNTIILAGENGCGKSTVLNILFEFSNLKPPNISTNEKREFRIILSDKEVQILQKNMYSKAYFEEGLLNNELVLELDLSIKQDWRSINITYTTLSLVNKEVEPSILSQEEIHGILKSIFSDAEINFNPSNIQYVTAQDVDLKTNMSIKSSVNLATEITQLLIDIQALDDAEFAEWGRNNIGECVDRQVIDTRMKRFKDAFNFMFSNKRYKKVINKNNIKKVIFEENGKEIPIERLSSGEKQIVFRGSFLLKDIKSNNGVLVLIDEPEISLHPKWQLNILDFFKRLFKDENGEQTSQIIIASHSPFIIHNDSSIMDKVIVMNRDINGNITIPDNPEYFGWTFEKAVQKAFNLNLSFDSPKTIVFVEGETDEQYIIKAIETLEKTNLDIQIKWIGRENERGNVEFTGDTALNHTKSFILSNPDILKHKTILLYDSDTNKCDEDLGNLFIRCMPKSNDNTTYKIGIENLLSLPVDFLKNLFYKERKKIDDYGAESVIKELDKMKLCNWVCNDLADEQQKQYLKNFELIFNIIESVIRKT